VPRAFNPDAADKIEQLALIVELKFSDSEYSGSNGRYVLFFDGGAPDTARLDLVARSGENAANFAVEYEKDFASRLEQIAERVSRPRGPKIFAKGCRMTHVSPDPCFVDRFGVTRRNFSEITS
jgi:hypothetical protein